MNAIVCEDNLFREGRPTPSASTPLLLILVLCYSLWNDNTLVLCLLKQLKL